MTRSHVRARGIALIAVLWLVAAMALIAVGMVHAVRSEIKTVGSDRLRAVYGAKSDAAVLLAVQQMQLPSASSPRALQTYNLEFEGLAVQVTCRALNGLIDLNRASTNLLAAMYVNAGQLPLDQALALALATVQYREAKGPSGLKNGLAAPEDLLNVTNFTYDLYAKLSSLVSADMPDGSGKINPQAAPLGVLMVLTSADQGRALALLAQQTGRVNGMDTTALNQEFVDSSVSRGFVVQAQTELPDGALLTTETTLLLSSDPVTGLSWRKLSTRRLVKAADKPNA